MPEYDHEHVMTLGEYLSALDPFLAVVTLVVLAGLFRCVVLCCDLVLRAIFREGP